MPILNAVGECNIVMPWGILKQLGGSAAVDSSMRLRDSVKSSSTGECIRLP